MIPTNHPIPPDAGVARPVALLDEDRYEFFAGKGRRAELDVPAWPASMPNGRP